MCDCPRSRGPSPEGTAHAAQPEKRCQGVDARVTSTPWRPCPTRPFRVKSTGSDVPLPRGYRGGVYGTRNRPAKHISFCVPQPGNVGSVRLVVSKVQVTRIRSPARSVTGSR
jgi:hypothetical protein